MGSKVMIRRNIDVSKGVVNGSMGTVDQFLHDQSGAVNTIYVKLSGNPDPIAIKRVSTDYLVSFIPTVEVDYI